MKGGVPENAKIIGGKFSLTIQDVDTRIPIYKASYVIQGRKDR